MPMNDIRRLTKGWEGISADQLTLAVVASAFQVGWYTAERGPVFNRIRSDPRFRALAAKVKKQRQQQRALLEEMRRKGEVPKRSQPGTQVLGIAAFDIAGFCHLLHVVSEGYPRGHRSRYGGLA